MAAASNASAASPRSEASRGSGGEGSATSAADHHDNDNGRILSAQYLERNKGKVRMFCFVLLCFVITVRHCTVLFYLFGSPVVVVVVVLLLRVLLIISPRELRDSHS